MRCRFVLATCVSIGLLTIAASAKAQAAPQAAHSNDDCLACHDDDSLKRGNGSPVTVHKSVFAASVHGPMNCVDCHADLASAELPHPEKVKKVDCAVCHTDQ